jgi:hypothetical protein
MNYQVRRQGVDLGIFSLEELRRRREAEEFSGEEYVQRDGMTDWQPLDLVLRQGYRVTPPPLPSSVSGGGPSHAVIWGIVALGIVLFAAFISLFVSNARKGYLTAVNHPRNMELPRPQAVTAASRPVSWTTNTLTQADASRRAGEFRICQWLDGYEKRGQRNPECDDEVIQFIHIWIARNYDGPEATNPMSLEAESEKLAADTNCTDPLVLTVIADNSLNEHDAIHRFERALDSFPDSDHKAYPRFYATVFLSRHVYDQPVRIAALDASALQFLRKCFADGSFTSANQQEIADIFVNGWGYNFFYRNRDAVCQIASEAGKNYEWLALTLDGEREIIEAWITRGGGYANSVTSEGWHSFSSHLAAARIDLTKAWNLQPAFPLAPERMIYVSLGDSDIDEMRTWFDRTVSAQIDYPRAWSDFRWGLRPRWYGSYAALLAFGKTAIKTGRFDTDVPRKFFDCVSDVESEMNLRSGEHIYGRDDIWPNMQKMYEGYIRASSENREGWRSTYAIVAYLAGKYGVAREQLEALNWKPQNQNLSGWGTDLSLMPLEVAARVGSLGKEVATAESSYKSDDTRTAVLQYEKLNNANGADGRTKEFIRHRLASLEIEQHLQKDEWVNFLPSQEDDPNWIFSRGKIQRLSDGAWEVQAGPDGHFLFSRVRVGSAFEVKGQFEVVHSSTKYFQAGLVMGATDINAYEWYAFRMRHHPTEGDNVSFSRAWNHPDISQPITLNDVTNTFDFRFQNGKVNASVNGRAAFQDVTPPATISASNDEFLLGLGAFNNSNETSIRYRNIQVRRLD